MKTVSKFFLVIYVSLILFVSFFGMLNVPTMTYHCESSYDVKLCHYGNSQAYRISTENAIYWYDFKNQKMLYMFFSDSFKSKIQEKSKKIR